MLSARGAVLLALRQGPSYGRQLVRRIRADSGGHVGLGEGSIYPALRQLQGARLVRSWTVIPGRRRGGRARRYHELTERGVRVAEAAASALGALLSRDVAPFSAEDLELVGRRLELGAELSETVRSLRLPPSRRKGRKSAA